MQQRCNDKIGKYNSSAQERGHNFAPLGFETHGRFGQPVIDLLTRLASGTPDHVGYAVSDGATHCAPAALSRAPFASATMYARSRPEPPLRRP